MKWNRKWKIPHTVLEGWTMCFGSMSWSSRKKKECIFCNAYFVRRNFFNICVLSQCLVYWINFQNMYTFTYQKTLLHTLFYLFIKSSRVFSVSLRWDVFHPRMKRLKALRQLVLRKLLRRKCDLDRKTCLISMFSEIFSSSEHVLAAV